MIFFLLVGLSGMGLHGAPETEAPADRAIIERFNQMDRDGDGRLDAGEAGGAGFFRQAETERDGAVALAEATAAAGWHSPQPPPAGDRRTSGR